MIINPKGGVMKSKIIYILVFSVILSVQSASAEVIVSDVNAHVLTYDDWRDTEATITQADADNLVIDPVSGTISGNGTGSDRSNFQGMDDSIFDTSYSITLTKTSSTWPKLKLSGSLGARDGGTGATDAVYIKLESETEELFYFGIDPYSDGDADGQSIMDFSTIIDISEPGNYFLTIATNIADKEMYEGVITSSASIAFFSFDAELIGDSYKYAPVPLPAGVWLLLSGLGLAGGISRKKRR